MSKIPRIPRLIHILGISILKKPFMERINPIPAEKFGHTIIYLTKHIELSKRIARLVAVEAKYDVKFLSKLSALRTKPDVNLGPTAYSTGHDSCRGTSTPAQMGVLLSQHYGLTHALNTLYARRGLKKEYL